MLTFAMAAATTSWWYFQWGNVPGHFVVGEAMAARGTFAPSQPDQAEMYRVLFPWIYMGLVWATGAVEKLPLASAQFISALVFFFGCLRLYRHERSDPSWHELMLVGALFSFYSTGAYQSGNRYGELLAPGLLALSLATSGLTAVAVIGLLAFQRIDYAVLALLVSAIQLTRSGWSVPAAAGWVVRAIAVAAVVLLLRSAVSPDSSAPTQVGLYHDDGRLKILDALNPFTWVWHIAYVLPALLLVLSQGGRWSVAMLVGAIAGLAAMRVFGSWSEVRLLMPSVILLVCSRSGRSMASKGYAG